MIYPDTDLVLQYVSFFSVRVTVYCPGLLYVCTGFFSVELVPSPKSQFHEVDDPILSSVNSTFNGAFPEVEDAEKSLAKESS